LVRYVFEGSWTARDLLDRRQELLRAGQLTARTAVLFDLRPATAFASLADLHRALQATGPDAVWPACRAFLVSTEEQHNCARQLQAVLGPDSVINEIFRDESTAYEWLSAMTGSAPSTRA
jgi:hypothetical protein